MMLVRVFAYGSGAAAHWWIEKTRIGFSAALLLAVPILLLTNPPWFRDYANIFRRVGERRRQLFRGQCLSYAKFERFLSFVVKFKNF